MLRPNASFRARFRSTWPGLTPLAGVPRSPRRLPTGLARVILCIAVAAAVAHLARSSAPRLDAASPSGFTNFETEPVRPLALSPDGTRLYALNTADDRLEVLAVSAEGLSHLGEVGVGLRPVAVAARGDAEVWVSNHLSDSVSVVDVSDPAAPRVVRTLAVGDEPRDIVVAGPNHDRVFVATARRSAAPAPGEGQAAVWVFDAARPEAPAQVVPLFGTKPRGLAASPDGRRVYAAIFHSGNGTTTLDERTVAENQGTTPTPSPGPTLTPSSTPGVPSILGAGLAARPAAGRVAPRSGLGGTGIGQMGVVRTRGTVQQAAPVPGGIQQLTPTPDPDALPAPPVSLILRQAGRAWIDHTGRDWRAHVPYRLPDQDVWVIDAAAAMPREIGSVAGVGTILFNLTVQPGTGEIWVTNTEARNMIRYEPYVSGRAVNSRVTRLKPAAAPDTFQVVPQTLNPHLAVDPLPRTEAARALSLSQPTDIVWNRDGSRAYTAVFGSNRVAVLDAAGQVVDRLVVGAGPGGLALDEVHGRLYVLNQLDATLSTVDLATQAVTSMPLTFDPVPEEIRAGQPLLYDAARSSGTGDQSCASCHVFGDLDGLAWDLGAPGGQVLRMPFELTHENFVLKPRDFRFHPEKGPMVVQSLRGMAGTGPLHWRGDRFTPEGEPPTDMDNFKQFKPAFTDLLGRTEPLPDADMEAFGRFVFSLRYPPNPLQNLDRSLTADQRAGADLYSGEFPTDSGVTNCEGCHTLPLGTNGLINFEGDRSGQDFKVPHFRNMYEKVGRFNRPGDLVTGYGFTHDGSTDTIQALLETELFTFPGDVEGRLDSAARNQMAAYLLAFDTGMAPAVGQQVTVAGTPAAAEQGRLALLTARASAGDCDLIARGRVAGVEAGWLWLDSRFVESRRGAPTRDLADLLRLATQPRGELTFTCVPPGDGMRSALDRDRDGFWDGDERALGSDPANPASRPGELTRNPVFLPVVRNGGGN
jgi:DNA-binding beta-propeller fold protein YncE